MKTCRTTLVKGTTLLSATLALHVHHVGVIEVQRALLGENLLKA